MKQRCMNIKDLKDAADYYEVWIHHNFGLDDDLVKYRKIAYAALLECIERRIVGENEKQET